MSARAKNWPGLGLAFSVSAASVIALPDDAGAFADPPAKCYAHIVMDTGTGQIYSAQNTGSLCRPASLTKLATLLLVFDTIAAEQLNLDDKINMSESAADTPPYNINRLKPGDELTVRDAIHGIAIKSANNVAVLMAEVISDIRADEIHGLYAEQIAEYLAGEPVYSPEQSLRRTEDGFAVLMNKKLKEIGLQSTLLVSASGLDSHLRDHEQRTTVTDMAILLGHLLEEYPEQMKNLFEKDWYTFETNGRIGFGSHNALRNTHPGKTGYTDDAGYTWAAWDKEDPEKIIVVFGRSSSYQRTREAQRLARAFDRGMFEIPALTGDWREYDPRGFYQIENPFTNQALQDYVAGGNAGGDLSPVPNPD